MGKASSAKKVARVARAGGGGKSSKRGSKPLFPMAIGLIVVLGVALIVFARTSPQDAAAEAPVANQDHWHAAYGIRLCGDGFLAPIQVQDDPVGIHTHGDGIVHVHPFTNASSGENATLGEFFDAAGVTIDDNEISVGDTTVKEGDDTCGADDKPGVVQVAVWENAREADGTDPEIVTEDIRDIRFTNDSMAITIAFAPDGADIPAPPTIPTLDNLTDVEPTGGGTTGTVPFDPATATSLPAATGQSSESTDSTATTAAGTDTTAAP